MSLFDDVSVVVRTGDLEGFKGLIETNLGKNNTLLEQPFHYEGKSTTLLGYLITRYKEDNLNGAPNLMPFIEYVYNKSTDKLIGYPVHQAVSENKPGLAMWFFNKLSPEHVNVLDDKRRTILSYVLETKNSILLKNFLLCNPSVHHPSHIGEEGLLTFPLQQAIQLDFEDGMNLLQEKGAISISPWGDFGETNVLLAARLGKMASLQSLLNFSLRTNNFCDLDATNGQVDGWNAIEHLCYKLYENGANRTEILKGIASLISCGAAAPRSSYLCDILAHDKVVLFEMIESYVTQHKQLIPAFYNRCHQLENPLHTIFYGSDNWKTSLNKLFCVENPIALKIEALVMPEENASVSKEPNLYAEFVRRYDKQSKSEHVKNPWSDMGSKIFQGKMDWDTVRGYATLYPNSRTGKIVAEMRTQHPEQVINKSTNVENRGNVI